MRTRTEVEHAFTHHPPRNNNEIDFYNATRMKGKELALLLFDELPECAERTLAIRHIEQAVMYANAGCARHTLAHVLRPPHQD